MSRHFFFGKVRAESIASVNVASKLRTRGRLVTGEIALAGMDCVRELYFSRQSS